MLGARTWPSSARACGCATIKIHAADCAECETREGRIDRIEREIELTGALSADERARLIEIADKCPVHRTLHSEVQVVTREREA